MKKTLEDIRAIIDPEGYLTGMKEVHANYKKQLARLLVDYDLMTDSPEIMEDQRPEVLETQLGVLRDVEWRMSAIDERIKDAKDSMAGNRASKRRRSKKDAKKDTE